VGGERPATFLEEAGGEEEGGIGEGRSEISEQTLTGHERKAYRVQTRGGGGRERKGRGGGGEGKGVGGGGLSPPVRSE